MNSPDTEKNKQHEVEDEGKTLEWMLWISRFPATPAEFEHYVETVRLEETQHYDVFLKSALWHSRNIKLHEGKTVAHMLKNSTLPPETIQQAVITVVPPPQPPNEVTPLSGPQLDVLMLAAGNAKTNTDTLNHVEKTLRRNYHSDNHYTLGETSYRVSGGSYLIAKIREKLAAHPNLPQHILDYYLQYNGDGLIRDGLLKNPRTPGKYVGEVAVAAGGHAWEKPQILALRHPNLPYSVVRQFIDDSVAWNSLAELATNQHLTPDTYHELHNTKNGNVVLALLANPACPEDILWAEAFSRQENRRAEVAGNRSTPEPIILQMWQRTEKSTRVLEALMANRHTPLETLREHFNHSNRWVSEAALKNYGRRAVPNPDGSNT